eukprot:5430800-Pleurochrysis_carterae.AAC.1
MSINPNLCYRQSEGAAKPMLNSGSAAPRDGFPSLTRKTKVKGNGRLCSRAAPASMCVQHCLGSAASASAVPHAAARPLRREEGRAWRGRGERGSAERYGTRTAGALVHPVATT